MLDLLLRIVFTVSFSHLLRFSQARTRRPMNAAAINYAVAAVGCTLWAVAARNVWAPPTVLLGSIAGFTYVSSLVLMLPSMRKSGVSVTGAVVQVSLMLPVAVAIWRFREYPNGYQIAGMLLTLVALPLLSASTAVHASGGVPARFSPLTLVLFFSTGASQVVMKEFAGTRPEAELPLYSAALFAAATFFTYLWMALSGDTGQATAPPEDAGNGGTPDGKLIPESLIGVALGLINVLQLLFLLRALHSLPAVVVFPVSAALGITANVLASVLLWKERPPMAGWIGIALAIAAVVLLNLK